MAAGDPGSPARYYSSTAVETSLQASIPAQSQGQSYTSFIVASISGFPTSFPYTLIVDPDTSKEEVITVTSGTSTTLTVTRGSDNTQAVAHSAGAVVRHGVSGRDFRESENHIAARGYDIDEAILVAANQTHVHGIATGEGVVVGTLKTQTLSNKTLVSPTITGTPGLDTSIVFEGSTPDAYETTLTVVDPTADRIIYLPDAGGNVVIDTATQTLTNKTLTSPTISGSPVITGLSSAGMVASSATPKDYVDAILGSATAAATSAASAATSATSAATSASSASTSASSALTSANSASTSATAAATSATSAAASATAAATSATSAAASATTAQAWAVQLVTPVSGSDYSAKYNANLAATSASSAATSASSAATSATSAANSATASATSASASATSASAAATSATSAAASATAAATSATSAAASATAAATSAASAAASATAAAGYVVPSQTGNAGKYLQTDGSTTSWQLVSGDIESITAGDGLTGGGTSGAVTLAVSSDVLRTTGGQIISANTSANALEIRQIGAGNALVVEDETNPDASPIVVNSSGQLFIGKTTANSNATYNRALQLEGTSATNSSMSLIRNGAEPAIFMARSNGTTLGSFTAVANNETIGNINYGAADGTSFVSGVVQIIASVDGTVSTGVIPTRLTFLTASTSGVNTERMRITSAGLLGIGGTPSGAMVQIFNNTAANVGTIIRGAASQTGDLLQIQNSAGTVLFTIDSSGDVGIGQTVPTSKLAVVGASASIATFTDNTNATVTIATPSSLVGSIISNQALTFQSATTERMRIDTSGDITISASTTDRYLRVGANRTGNAYSYIDLQGDATYTDGLRLIRGNTGANSISGMEHRGTGAFQIVTREAAPLVIYTNNTERMRIDSSGNVGINTTTMSGRFNVQGTAAGVSAYFTDGVNSSLVVQNLAGGVTLGTDSGGAIHLATNGSASGNRRLSIDASGNTTINAVADATTTTAARGGGYMGIPQSAAATTGAYTVVAADAGEHIYSTATRTVTIPANSSVAFPVGTVLTFIAGSGATVTIAITTDTMYLAGAGTTGSRTLAAFGVATAVKITSTSWIISGNGLT
jgi:hypothetical protein